MKIKERRGVIDSDPAAEQMMAARSNLGHAVAVQRCEDLTQRLRGLWSKWDVPASVELNQILRALSQKRIPFVLTGAHGIAAWTGRVRATHDVDVLVKAGRNHGRAVKAVKALYPQLECIAFPGVTGFFPPGEKESVIDVSYPHRDDLAETLATATWVEDRKAGLKYRVPTLEAALANKYGAMVAFSRDLPKRIQDSVDFYWMVVHSHDESRKPIDRVKLATLGAKVGPEGGADEILRIVDEVQAGRAIDVNSLH
jgi:hypothetical protein